VEHPCHKPELDRLIEIVRAEKLTSFLEIGSRHGYTLDAIARSMPKGSTIVSVDMPNRMWGRPDSQIHLEKIVAGLNADGYSAHMHLGKSQAESTVDFVAQFGQFGLIYIDADHRYEGVKRDWEAYGPLGSLIAFHDIAVQRPEVLGHPDDQIEVKQLWDEIKSNYKHEALVCDLPPPMGIGVIWR
jgi:predicted O-methyltransferase YrrM